jgi:hypothetical protein
MVPSYYTQVAAFPLTGSGKLDRRSLPSPARTVAGGYEGPRNVVEERLAELWGEVLGLPPSTIGIRDNFFRLGGHSLNIIQLKEKLDAELNRDIPVTIFFQYFSIEALGQYLKEGAKNNPVTDQDVNKEKISAGKQRIKKLLANKDSI